MAVSPSQWRTLASKVPETTCTANQVDASMGSTATARNAAIRRACSEPRAAGAVMPVAAAGGAAMPGGLSRAGRG